MYSQATAVVRIWLSAVCRAWVTFWLVSITTARPVPPPTARASRFGAAVAASVGPNTPITKVGTAGVPAAPAAATAAMPGMSTGVHSVGRPSVTSTTATLRSGVAVARACADWIAPDSAGPVGVSPSGWCMVREVVSPAADRRERGDGYRGRRIRGDVAAIACVAVPVGRRARVSKQADRPRGRAVAAAERAGSQQDAALPRLAVAVRRAGHDGRGRGPEAGAEPVAGPEAAARRV